MGGLAKGLAIIEAFATHGVLSVSDAARARAAPAPRRGAA